MPWVFRRCPLWVSNLYFLFHMGLFNFTTVSNNDDNSAQDIQLIVNDETVTVPAAEADGMTIRQLFDRFAAGICDTDRINRFISLGRIVDESTKAEAGVIYSGAIASESKG